MLDLSMHGYSTEKGPVTVHVTAVIYLVRTHLQVIRGIEGLEAC